MMAPSTEYTHSFPFFCKSALNEKQQLASKLEQASIGVRICKMRTLLCVFVCVGKLIELILLHAKYAHFNIKTLVVLISLLIILYPAALSLCLGLSVPLTQCHSTILSFSISLAQSTVIFIANNMRKINQIKSSTAPKLCQFFFVACF